MDALFGTGVSDFNFSGATTAIAISTNVTFIDKVLPMIVKILLTLTAYKHLPALQTG